MQVKSLKFNFFMGIIRMATGVCFPIIIMPYINRVLNPELIGKVEFANTIVNYFILFTSLGIPVYGVREIAKARDSLEERSKIFIEFAIILLVMNVIMYIIYFCLLYFNPMFQEEKTILYIFSLNIFFTTFSFEWFYQGIEDQKQITVRTIIVRSISIVGIFLFVKSSADYLNYALILSIGIIGGNIFNIILLRKYISISKEIFIKIKPLRHIKYILVTFAAGLLTTVYTQMDILMIGDFVGMSYVGLYNMPLKFILLMKSVITIFGATLLPRLTNLYSDNKINEYKVYVDKSFSGLILYCLFVTINLYILSEDIIEIFGGEKFLDSIITLKILSLTVIFSGFAYFKGVVILYSQKKDQLFLYSVLIAALINFILNYKLIPKYNQNGAAMATLIAEISVIIFINIFTRKNLKLTMIFSKNNLKCFLASLIIIAAFSFIKINLNTIYIKLILKEILIIFLYFFILIIFKENLVIETVKIIRQKMLKNK